MSEEVCQHIRYAGDTKDYEDVMDCDRMELSVLDKGFVALVDIMPRHVPEDDTADFAVVQAARTSYGKGTKSKSSDRSLLRYMMRHQHTSPFEMVVTKWHCRMPIFIARQWVRHRTAAINEYSGRYSVMPNEFFRPSEVRAQSGTNKQGSDGLVDGTTAEEFLAYLDQAEKLAEKYEYLCEKNVDWGLARIGLPISIYTEWYWRMDLKNLLHFIKLRISPHAQEEIQEYAAAMLRILNEVCPVTVEAFRDYVLDAVTLTGPEQRALKDPKLDWRKHLSKRECDELGAKMEAMGLEVCGVKR